MDTDQPVAKKARYVSPEDKEIIINVYKYVEEDTSPENHSDASDDTAEMPGLNQPPGRKVRGRKSRRCPIMEIMDYQTLTAIRKKIYRFFEERGRGVPTPENILREVNEDERLPNFAMPTFRRVLRHLKYRHYVTRNRNDVSSRFETFSIPAV